MKTPYKISQSIAVLLSMFAIVASPLSANAAIFAKFDGVDGESQDAQHQGWIDVLSTDWGVAKITQSSGTTRAGSSKVDPFVIRHELDKSSPKLQEKLWRGEVIPKLTVEYTEVTGGGNRVTYMKLEMERVYLVGFKFDGVDGEATDSRPMMGISLAFEEIKVTYSEYDDDGNLVGEVSYTHNIQTGV